MLSNEKEYNLIYLMISQVPSTYASLDLNAEPPPSLLMLGNIVDIDGRFPIDMNSLSLGDEYQITFYSV